MSEPKTVDLACREAIERYRLDAFDNVDVEALLSIVPMPNDRGAWIARHLLRQGRSADAHKAGQQILRLLNAVDVA